MLYILCWSDAEAAIVFGVTEDAVREATQGGAPLPRHIAVIYMPLASMLLCDLADSGHWNFPPRDGENDAPLVET